MIRVFLADEHPVVLAGLRSFFCGTEFQVVGEASSGLELVRELERACPHVILIDTTQSSFQGFTEKLLVGATKSCRWRYRVLENSPALKAAARDALLEIVRRISPKRIDGRSNRVVEARSNLLTPRETEILRLIVQGQCNKEIARTLGISLDTVKEHVRNILRKTSLSDRTQAALWAVRQEIASL